MIYTVYTKQKCRKVFSLSCKIDLRAHSHFFRHSDYIYIYIYINIIIIIRAGPSLQAQEPRLQFYQGWTGAVVSHCFPHPTLSLASKQTLKDLKRSQGSNVEVRRVDLANWALQTPPKFTTGVKYQFHQGFWPDQRSGNPNHPSPPYIYVSHLGNCNTKECLAHK